MVKNEVNVDYDILWILVLGKLINEKIILFIEALNGRSFNYINGYFNAFSDCNRCE